MTIISAHNGPNGIGIRAAKVIILQEDAGNAAIPTTLLTGGR